jgi:ribosomal protein S18 acetylase RimI-like enzyme
MTPSDSSKRPGLSLFVRDAIASDFNEIARLTADVYVGEGFSPPTADAVLRDVAGRSSECDLIVATDQASGQLVGSVCLVVNGQLVQAANPDEAEIRLLAVDRSARGRGVGDALVRDCVRRALKAGRAKVVLSTQPSMAAAQRLYLRLGFVRAESRDWTTADGRQMLVHVIDASSDIVQSGEGGAVVWV